MLKSMKIYGCLLTLLVTHSFAHAQVNPQYVPVPANFNLTNPNAVVAPDIRYDNIDPSRQAFHLFLPDTTGTYPLVVYYHGGGFTGGSRSTVFNNPDRRARVKFFLDRGIAYASVGYRLLDTVSGDTIGVRKCMGDSKRGLQFIRYYAGDLHLDPQNIVLSGNSAGAGTALWLATHPDMADPSSPDPVLQTSTRVCAVEMWASQSTYDIYKWESLVYDNYDGQGTDFTIDSIVDLLGFPLYSSFYGGLDSNYHLLHDPLLIQYREDIDMLYHLSSDDPPIYFSNYSGAVYPSQDLYHHSLHGKAIHEAALQANLPEVKADIPALGINTTQGETPDDFLLRHLTNGCTSTTERDLPSRIPKMVVYPNPAHSQLRVSLHGGTIAESALFSLTGKLVRESRNLGTGEVVFEVSMLRPGIYFLRLTDQAGQVQNARIIIE